jgi:sugar phosphate isomerase/epimerase
MRLGAPLFGDWSGPDEWVDMVERHGYSAAYCPLPHTAPDDEVRAYEDAARAANVVIAEVGAWSNPMAPEEKTRTEALAFCKAQLHLADRIGARCCVNISGSRGSVWDGPHKDNLTQETFDLIVTTVRDIIDAVAPTRTFFTLETMPWMYPDSPDSYVRLIEAVDRERFGVHLDPTNLVCSPQRYFSTPQLLHECFERLGPHVRSCHGKDIHLEDKLMTHLDEVIPGKGNLDYRVYLSELARLDADVPLMLEHLSTEDEYRQAAAFIRGVAEGEGLSFVD